MKRNCIIIGIVLFGLGVLIGRVTVARNAVLSTSATSKRRYVISAAACSQPFFSGPRRAWERIANVTPGLEMIFEGPTNSDANKQIEELEALISQKVDGIVVFPSDPKALAPVINKAVANGIPVITIFADVPESKRLTFIGASEVQSAQDMTELVLKDFPQLTQKPVDVMVSFANPVETCEAERLKGVLNILDKHADKIHVVDVVQDDADDVKGADAIHAVLLRHPNIKAIFGLDARSAIGAISALKESGKKPGDVVVTGWDSDEDVLKAIQNGWVHVSPVLHAKAMVQMCFAFLEADHFGYLYTDSNPKHRELSRYDIPNKIIVPENLVTGNNVEAYLRKE